MRKTAIFLCVAGAVLPSSAYAQNSWELATLIDEEVTGGPGFNRCTYDTLGGYRFSMVVRGQCPLSVKVNPQTGEVQR